jgi:photosystem II stability/assembly factor-like uncharacterized protein
MSKLPKGPRTVFVLDKTHAWLVTEGGIHFSNDFGRRWDRISKLKNVARVAFLDPQRGFAVGAPKKIWQTTNGGKDWIEVPEAAAPKSEPERSMYHWVHFSSPLRGTILGFHEPRRRESGFPDWMDPEGARQRRQLPSLALLLETLDGGKTWTPSTSSIFGRIMRYYVTANGNGLALVEYQNAFDWPSEIYHADHRAQKMTSSFKAKDRVITDIALMPNGIAYAAGMQPSGAVARLPIPGKVVILRSTDLKNWHEMEVDYRAVADRLWLTVAPGGSVWAATDTGMILELTGQ